MPGRKWGGIKVFLSYSRGDDNWHEALHKKLQTLKDEDMIKVWWDREVPSGANWYDEVMRNLKEADLILLLMSPEFVNSRFCHDELKQALERRKKKKACVIPIILSDCDWRSQPGLAALQALPRGGALLSRPDDEREAALDEVAEGIRKAAEERWNRKLRQRRVLFGTFGAVSTVVAVLVTAGMARLLTPTNNTKPPQLPRIVREFDAGAWPTPFRDHCRSPTTCRDSALPKMVKISMEEFDMGSPLGEQGRHLDEGPQHRGTIGRTLAVGTAEVTFDEWQACMDGGGCNYWPDDNRWGRGDRPVINVSWDDAQTYVRWLSNETGHRYRLLTEAEWEYAARARTSTAHYWGEAIDSGRANCSHCNGLQTAPVGSYRPNGFGLYDMLGNVWEWMQSCYRDNMSVDCAQAGPGVQVIARGASWNNPPDEVRLDRPLKERLDFRDGAIGFRVAREAMQNETPRDKRQDCPSSCPWLVVIPAKPAGTGSPGDEMGRPLSAEEPHRGAIEKPLAVSITEVTFAEWQACVAEGGCAHRPDDKGWGRGDRPVIDVSYRDAWTYVQWLRRKTGLPYRLLTEDEWEYAAKAGTTTVRPWGDDIDSGKANCDRCNGQKTAPVRSYRPNDFGLYDMLGNVWEWTQDCYRDNYDGPPTDGSAVECEQRVARGGSWNNPPDDLRAARRLGLDPKKRNFAIGFRVARDCYEPGSDELGPEHACGN